MQYLPLILHPGAPGIAQQKSDEQRESPYVQIGIYNSPHRMQPKGYTYGWHTIRAIIITISKGRSTVALILTFALEFFQDSRVSKQNACKRHFQYVCPFPLLGIRQSGNKNVGKDKVLFLNLYTKCLNLPKFNHKCQQGGFQKQVQS